MNEKITIQDIANSLKEKQGLTKKDAELFVKSMFDIMKEALASDKYVKVKGLGTFKLTEVESRESINVNTGERFEIQGHTKISFTPDTTLKEQINKPFSHFETVILNDGVDFEDIPTENLEPQPEETEVATKEQEVACSGILSYSPSIIPLKPLIESSNFTYFPFTPENCSATKKG